MSELTRNSFFTVLANSRRLDILHYLLENGSQSVTAIARGTELEQSAVSHNLHKLLSCQFVHVEARGKHHYYSLNNETIIPLFEIIDQHMSKYCHDTCNCCMLSTQNTRTRMDQTTDI